MYTGSAAKQIESRLHNKFLPMVSRVKDVGVTKTREPAPCELAGRNVQTATGAAQRLVPQVHAAPTSVMASTCACERSAT